MSESGKICSIEEYQSMVQLCYALGVMAEAVPTEVLLASIERADSVGWFIDPTLWRDKGPALRQDKKIVEAIRYLKLVMKELRQG